jgi:hypothetical protein
MSIFCWYSFHCIDRIFSQITAHWIITCWVNNGPFCPIISYLFLRWISLKYIYLFWWEQSYIIGCFVEVVFCRVCYWKCSILRPARPTVLCWEGSLSTFWVLRRRTMWLGIRWNLILEPLLTLLWIFDNYNITWKGNITVDLGIWQSIASLSCRLKIAIATLLNNCIADWRESDTACQYLMVHPLCSRH